MEHQHRKVSNSWQMSYLSSSIQELNFDRIALYLDLTC